jgi:hypothetical protein
LRQILFSIEKTGRFSIPIAMVTSMVKDGPGDYNPGGVE